MQLEPVFLQNSKLLVNILFMRAFSLKQEQDLLENHEIEVPVGYKSGLATATNNSLNAAVVCQVCSTACIAVTMPAVL